MIVAAAGYLEYSDLKLIEFVFFASPVPVSSRGQDTWFSATGPGFESPYRYTLSLDLSVDPCLGGRHQSRPHWTSALNRWSLRIGLKC
jgi:hypothetical protein